MTETQDLAQRADLSFGETRILPSLRTIAGPSSKVSVEPRVMQVLLALYDAKGAVLSRDRLLEICWGGVVVGDDAINRTIAEIRRVVRETGAQFEIETIPRIGYRFTAEGNASPASAAAKPLLARVDRRKIVAGALGSVAIIAGSSIAIIYSGRRRKVDALIERGRTVLASGGANANKEAATFFRAALKIDDQRADVWGWLARSLEDPSEARNAARQALKFDPREANAKLVLIKQRQDLINWVEWEDAVIEVLDYSTENTLALAEISHFYQCVGRCKDNWNMGERLFKLEPFNPGNQHRRAYRHWIFGKIAEADKIVDQSLRLWPRDPYVWNARLLIYAFTDRAQAALSLLEDVASRPTNLTPPSIASWRAALTALASRSSSDIDQAIKVCTSAASLAPGLAVNAIMTFSYLGELDEAYNVAEGLFVGKGKVVQKVRGEGIKDTYSEPAWGRTQALFIPASAAFREDKRFYPLCERMGHVAYWNERGIWPDPFVRGSLRVS